MWKFIFGFSFPSVSFPKMGKMISWEPVFSGVARRVDLYNSVSWLQIIISMSTRSLKYCHGFQLRVKWVPLRRWAFGGV